MTINNSKLEYENMNMNVNNIYVNKIVTTSDLKDVTMLQYNNYLIIITFTFSFKISENDNKIILNGER